MYKLFDLDIEGNSSLENGTVQAARLRKTDVIIIDKLFMLDFRFSVHTFTSMCLGHRLQHRGSPHVDGLAWLPMSNTCWIQEHHRRTRKRSFAL